MTDTLTAEETPAVAVAMSPREQALTDVCAADERLAYWIQEVAAAEADLADLQKRSGTEALADPSTAGRLAHEMASLREQMGIAHRAREAAARETMPPRRAALLAEAEELQDVLTAAEEELAAFDAQTAQLLEALETHTGVPWAVREFRLADNPGQFIVPAGTRAALAQRVAAATRPILVLRAVAQGRDPRQDVEGLTADDYPASVWGPHALIPAPQYGAAQHTQAKLQAELEAALVQAEQSVATVRTQLDRIDAESRPNFATKAERQEHDAALAARRAQRQAVLDRHEADVVSLRERLAAVTP